MDNINPKAIKIVLYVSVVFAVLGAVIASLFLNVPLAIGIFFGLILGFFLPWVVALLGYTFYALSDPRIAFGDQIDKQKK